jgi:hypothetical protein
MNLSTALTSVALAFGAMLPTIAQAQTAQDLVGTWQFSIQQECPARWHQSRYLWIQSEGIVCVYEQWAFCNHQRSSRSP